jgi:dephospho-CoA kinase
MLRNKDSLLIDADKLAHELFSSGSSVYQKVRKHFGLKIITKNNENIDREKLAEIVFADPAALSRLNRIVHPELIRQIQRRLRDSRKKIVILDAALIVEAGLTGLVDKLVVVTAKRKQQSLRSQKSLGLTKGQANSRIKSQISQKAKSRFADFIIDNSGQLSKTRKQVFKIRRQLWKS